MGRSFHAWCQALLLCAALLTGCKHSTEKLSANTKSFEVKGVVVAMDPAQGELTLKHDAIPGFMGAMTMPYRLMFGEELSELHEGDVIRARLLVQKTADGEYRNARLDEIAVLAQSKPNFKPASSYHVPSPGDAVPDFKLVNQDGKLIQINEFRGKALLITFIYTRCPLGDFCPRMSRNFAAIEGALNSDADVLDKTQLLSISFDPAFDTPAVMRAYGAAYTEGNSFKHWQFAVPVTETLQALEHYFNVGVTGQNETLTHSLSTVLVDPAGKIAAWYPGNEWQPAEVVAKIRSMVQTGAPHIKTVAMQAGAPLARQ